jgi:superfamily II DNA or RNA helicase
VGIDIDRLSLMLIVGQPKSSAQYIQVSGRVGRRWHERPGLVVTLLNPRRPRDRSHYERFREFHQSIYAAVEPASVTPFAPSAVDRGMPGLITAAVRSRVAPGDESTPYRTPEHLLDRVRSSIIERVRFVDPEEEDRVASVVERRLNELRNWGRTRWDDRDGSDDSDEMIIAASDDAAASPNVHHWRVMQSLRSVDAECEVMPIVFSDEEDESLEEVQT